MRTAPFPARLSTRVACTLAAIGLLHAAALAQNNSPQATAAAKAHFAEKRAAAASAPKAKRPASPASAAASAALAVVRPR